MPRNILGNKDFFRTEPDSNIEYKPPEEELVNSELINRLVDHYIAERDKERVNLGLWEKGDLGWPTDFSYCVGRLESMIKTITDKPQPQLIDYCIDRMTYIFKDEPSSVTFSRTRYLTAVCQALYNLGYGSNFRVDISDWPEGDDDIGRWLKGKPSKPLTLEIYGEYFDAVGFSADYCNFKVYGRVRDGGDFAKHCCFTFYDNVAVCGSVAEDCIFDLMPNAEIGYYGGSGFLNNNILRRMKKKGDWEILSSKTVRKLCD